MADLVAALRAMPTNKRKALLRSLTSAERQTLNDLLEQEDKNPAFKYRGDPVGFIENILHETVWSKQRDVLNSIVQNQRTAVPACHAPGKTHLAARAVAYWLSVYPVGTAKVVTTATNFKQVKHIMWPHIRRLQGRHLPELGYTNTVEWMIGKPAEAAAEGIKPPDDEEAGMQGYHAPNLLLVVDEAGGIKNKFGQSIEALMTGSNTRLLVLGNPPTDAENSWFERICNSGEYNVVRIGAFDTPGFTGEDSGLCQACPPGMPPHEVKTHLVDEAWVQSQRREFGEDSAWWEARVLALFPKDAAQKALPMSWLEPAMANELPPDPRARIKLGVDIASDGGDEFVIAKLDGWKATVEHAISGADNENAVSVAGVVKNHIIAAEEEHERRGISERVRVKIDSIGVGWGVVSLLKAWKDEGLFKADIVGVNVGQTARDSKKFVNQRAEMWWATRELIQPDPEGEQVLWLNIDTRELAQLNGPLYGTNSSGRIQIEKKADMKKRGMKSPDRAEAILLAIFEPPTTAMPAAPIPILQTNMWGTLG